MECLDLRHARQLQNHNRNLDQPNRRLCVPYVPIACQATKLPFLFPILLYWDTGIVNDKDMHAQYYDKLIGKGSECTLVIFFMIAFEKVLTSKTLIKI